MNDAIWNRCDLEQKLVRFRNNHTAESQSDCTDSQWFQSGCNKTNKIFFLITVWLNPTRERYSWKEGQVFYLTLTILRLVVTVHDVCLSVLTNKVKLITTWLLKETEVIRWANHSSKNSHVRWMVVRASRWITVFLWFILINEITAVPVRKTMSQS